MLLDWIAREGWIILNWWVLLAIAGATALPLVTRLLSSLPDRGYTLARPAGMLLIAFVFWLMAVLGLVNNSAGSITLAWLVVLAAALLVYFNVGFSNEGTFAWREWWHENRSAIIITEVLFVVLLVGWAIVRAHQNDLTTTEKPMDLAFMSAAQQTVEYPPNDPWLSGYSISYYYFGYVMASMLSTMSGVWSTTGYNMHIALLFALTGTTAFGVVYNLIRSRAFRRKFTVPNEAESDDTDNRATELTVITERQPTQTQAILFGLLGMFFVIWMSNFHTVIVEIPLQSQTVSNEYLRFWDAKDRDSIAEGAEPRNFFNPSEMGYWWWFGASRTITERNLDGERVNEVIDEFPMFSFLLADSHPHVMALPFALLAMGLAVNVLLSATSPTRRQIVFYGICIGSLIFLNTWDSPIYISLLVGAEAVRRLVQRGQIFLIDWIELFILGLALLGITVLAYLPFLVGFQSQLSGVLVNILYPTRFQQLFVMFGPFFLILAFFIGVELWRGHKAHRLDWLLGLQTVGGILAGILLIVGILLATSYFVPATRNFAENFATQNGGWGEVIGQILGRRFAPMQLLTLIVLLGGIALVVMRLFPLIHRGKRKLPDEPDEINAPNVYPPATGFALLLVGLGLSLILLPEFVYLRDNFGWRMNTVFKFYYQAWVAFSVAGAYAAYTIMAEIELPKPGMAVRAPFGAMLVGIMVLGSIYPIFGTYHRMFIETNRASATQAIPLTLDGGSSFTFSDDYNAIMCLREQAEPGAVIAEAKPQGDRINYNSNHGRVGSLTGLPVIIGWPGHQSQWRGTSYNEVVGTRQPDLDTLYTDLRLDVVQRIINDYEIGYIFYGEMERRYYGSAGEEKFLDNFEVVCESGNTRVYRVNPLLTVAN